MRGARSRAGEEPWTWKSAWATLLTRAQSGLNEAPSAVPNWHVPAYYEDVAGHEAAKAVLRDDVNAAFDCALVATIGHGLSAGQRETYRAKARALINNWASVNTSVSGSASEPEQGKLTMSVVGTAFVTVAELLTLDPNWTSANRAQFTQWASTVLTNVADIEDRTNNWGSWGVFMGLSVAHWRDNANQFAYFRDRLAAHIDRQINSQGELPLELGRGGSGLWYTYHSLAPLTHAAFVLQNTTGEDLFRWQPPSGGTIEQAIGKLLAMTMAGGSTYSDWPQPRNWGGDLLFAAGHLYGRSDWIASADPPFGTTNSAWKTSDLLVPIRPVAPPPPPQPLAAPVLLN